MPESLAMPPKKTVSFPDPDHLKSVKWLDVEKPAKPSAYTKTPPSSRPNSRPTTPTKPLPGFPTRPSYARTPSYTKRPTVDRKPSFADVFDGEGPKRFIDGVAWVGGKIGGGLGMKKQSASEGEKA